MDIPSDWWRTFFSGMAVDFWLQATPPEQTRAEVDFIQKSLQVAPPARLLDVPCGGGRHSLLLASRGYRMTGVDLSADFLRAARSGAAQQGLPVTWEERPMRELPWSGEFDGAFCFGNSFGYDEEEGNAEFLKAVARALRPGARFVLDTSYVMEVLLPSFQDRSWFPMGELLFLAERSYEPERSRLAVEYTWIRDGRQEKRAMSARLYSYRELCRLLSEAGFREVQGFGSLAEEPFRMGSRQLLLVARKPA